MCAQIYKLPKIAIIFDAPFNFGNFQIWVHIFGNVLKMCAWKLIFPKYFLSLYALVNFQITPFWTDFEPHFHGNTGIHNHRVIITWRRIYNCKCNKFFTKLGFDKKLLTNEFLTNFFWQIRFWQEIFDKWYFWQEIFDK